MKLKPTFFGMIAARKKPIFSVLALALIAMVVPTLIANTHADDEIMGKEKTQTIYTTVGPDYFTFVDLSPLEGETIRIADTSIADFYYYEPAPAPTDDEEVLLEKGGSQLRAPAAGDFFSRPIPPLYCMREYACIQGKTIGETEILFESEDGETFRLPLVSVKLSPEAYNINEPGTTIVGTGSITGADDYLLELVNVGSYSGALATKTGDRSFSITISEDAPMYNENAYLSWRIGGQYVGGGTYYSNLTVNAKDNVSHSVANETILKKSMINIYKKLYSTGSIVYLPSDFSITADDGTIMHFTHIEDRPEYSTPSSIEITLDPTDESISNTTKDELASKLPEGAGNIKFATIKANVDVCYIEDGNWGIKLLGAEQQGESANTDVTCITGGEFTRLGRNLDLSIPVTDAEDLKSGYTRKWYVTKINDGIVEKLDTTYDETTKTIHFDSDSFGFYACGYIDEAPETPETASESDPDVPLVPNTGVSPRR